MKLIGCYNTKGGVGKTTLNLMFAKRLSKEGNKVLYIDADGQSNSTEFFYGIQHDNKTIYDALIHGATAEEVIIKAPNMDFPNLDFIPATDQVSELGEELGRKIAKEKVAARWFKKNITTLDLYDYIIVDLSPTTDIANRNFLYIMDSIIYIINYCDIASIRGVRKHILDYEKEMDLIEIPDTTNKAILVNCMKYTKSSVAEYFKSQVDTYCEADDHKLYDMLLENTLSNADAIKRSILENVDLPDISKAYRNKKVEQEFDAIIKELKMKEVL